MQNSQKFRAGTKNAVSVPRVLWHGVYITHRSSGYEYEMSYRTHRSSRYGYESLTELPEVPGIVARAYRTYLQKFRAGIKMLYSYPGYCGTGVYRS